MCKETGPDRLLLASEAVETRSGAKGLSSQDGQVDPGAGVAQPPAEQMEDYFLAEG